MTRTALLALIVLLPVAAAADPLEAGDRVQRVPTRDGVELPVLIREPKAGTPPVAVVVLLPGGGGRLGLTDDGLAEGGDNFMVRTRARFAAVGLVAIVVDAPSDRSESLSEFRVSAESAEDMTRLAAWAGKRWSAPIWFLGTSRGTLSVGNAAARGVPMAGLVLTSSVTAGKKEKATLLDVAIDRIAVPTFLLHHRHDGCDASPLRGAEKLRTALAHAPAVGWKVLDGGDEPTGGPCTPRSHHGFLGLDADAVDAIVGFIRSHAQ
jgi:hypothetical protein